MASLHAGEHAHLSGHLGGELVEERERERAREQACVIELLHPFALGKTIKDGAEVVLCEYLCGTGVLGLLASFYRQRDVTIFSMMLNSFFREDGNEHIHTYNPGCMSRVCF